MCSKVQNITSYRWLDIPEIGIWRPTIAFGHLLDYKKTKLYGGDKPFSFWFVKKGLHERIVYREEVQLSFSCPFSYTNYPFDSHLCTLKFGSTNLPTSVVRLKPSLITYDQVVPPIKHTLEDDPIILSDLPHPFQFEFNLNPALEKWSAYNYSYSHAGMEIKMKRKSLGKLLSSYYYPMAAFALLSMISFLIKADVVSKSFYGTSVLKLCIFEFVVIHEI